MSSTLDDLTLSAVAVPHDRTRAGALADCVEETHPHSPQDARVATTLRDPAAAPGVLAAVWTLARDRAVTPDYRVLWAVVTLGVGLPPAAPALAPDFAAAVGRGVERARRAGGGSPADPDDGRWFRTAERVRLAATTAAGMAAAALSPEVAAQARKLRAAEAALTGR